MRYYLLFLSLLVYIPASSQILKQYIAEGLSRNASLQTQDLAIEKAWQQVGIAESQQSLKVSFAPNYTLAAGGRRLSFPVGDLLNPVYSTLNALTNSQNFPTIENVNEQLAPNNFHETKFSFQYPLYSAAARGQVQIQRELWKLEKQKKEVALQNLRFSIEDAYLQYLQVKQVQKLVDSSLQWVAGYVQFNEQLVKNQVALPEVVLSARLEQEKLRQQQAEWDRQEKTARAYFNYLLYKPLDSPILLDESVLQTPEAKRTLLDWQQFAREHRAELALSQAGIQVQQAITRTTDADRRIPTAFIGGTAGFQGFGYTFQNQAFAIVQVGLQWDLWHGGEKRKKVAQAKVQEKIADQQWIEAQQGISLQITQAFYAWQASKQAQKTAQQGAELAQEILRRTDARYQLRQALPIEWQKAQTDWYSAQLQNIIQEIQTARLYLQVRQMAGFTD
ncbi:MAG: TolC family protein [Spirosomataceae bacterium]